MHVRTRLATRLTPAIALAACISLLAATAAPAQLQVGIGDQNPLTFVNPFYKGLGVKRTRLIVSYDAGLSPSAGLATWMSGAVLTHQEIVVAFNPGAGSRCPGQPCTAPSKAQYTRAFKAFHSRFPFVKIFQPWNEVNNLTEPTASHPEDVVTYYSVVKQYCHGCTVLGADIEDLKAGPGVPARIDEGNYARALLADFRRAHVAVPHLWGLHNYVDVNYFRSTGTSTALRVLPGQIWLTETGGIARFVLSSGKTRLKYDENRQANATKWLFKLALGNRRIARVYIYDMLYNSNADQRFDSSLLGAGQVPRKAYYVLKAHYAQYFS